MRSSLLALVVLLSAWSGSSSAAERVKTDEQGRFVPVPLSVPEELQNPWPKEYEERFRTRCDKVIRALGRPGGRYGTTYFESEKAVYPLAMAAYLAGHREDALKAFQEEDHQADSWHKQTDGIDLYAAFTLKGQMRKYFFLGEELDPDYRARMKRGAEKWTKQDPLKRPHPAFSRASGYGPDATNSWVDSRNTDNLRAMRETSVYLMAEETGNEEVRKIYLDRIRRYVWALYHVGMGEWDSENYHGHSLATWINLYDFAKDPEAKSLGKAALDWLFTAAAVKYYRGGFGGPIKRDYDKPVVGMGSAAQTMWLYAGDGPEELSEYERDLVFLATSAYRPPAAVVALARKEFEKPVELFASKPQYETWTPEPGEYASPGYQEAPHEPQYFETLYFGEKFQLGTLACGTPYVKGYNDVNGFKLLAANKKRGVDFFVPGAGRDPSKISTSGTGPTGQNRNVTISMLDDGDAPFMFLVPKSAKVEQEGDWTFVEMEGAWLAIRPLNMTISGVDEGLTRKANYKDEEKKQPRWPDEQIIAAKGKGGDFCGFALEVGEPATHKRYEDFKQAVQDKTVVELDQAEKGIVSFTGTLGHAIAFESYDDGKPVISRDGEPIDWSERWPLYQSASGEGPISLGWKEGRLQVEAGGFRFESELTDAGRYSFRHASEPRR